MFAVVQMQLLSRHAVAKIHGLSLIHGHVHVNPSCLNLLGSLSGVHWLCLAVAAQFHRTSDKYDFRLFWTPSWNQGTVAQICCGLCLNTPWCAFYNKGLALPASHAIQVS